MTRTLNLVQFFRVVPTVPRLIVAAFGVVAVSASITIWIAPSRIHLALVPLVVLQGFATSSSFLAPARRGYYDLLLTSGAGRMEIALAHWLLSAAPGLAS